MTTQIITILCRANVSETIANVFFFCFISNNSRFCDILLSFIMYNICFFSVRQRAFHGNKIHINIEELRATHRLLLLEIKKNHHKTPEMTRNLYILFSTKITKNSSTAHNSYFKPETVASSHLCHRTNSLSLNNDGFLILLYQILFITLKPPLVNTCTFCLNTSRGPSDYFSYKQTSI